MGEITHVGTAAVCYIGATMVEKERDVAPPEISELAAALDEQFIQRRDLYPRQREDGRYLAVHRPLQPQHLKAHLAGKMTLGAYVLDEESRGRYLVLDADDAPDWRRLKGLALALEEMGCPSYLEDSRRGGHLWIFFDRPLPGAAIRRFGRGLLAHFGIEGVELFPKQGRLRTGPGSLIRLPFGVHRKSGRRYGFYTADGEPLAPALREQVRRLAEAETAPETFLERFRERGRERGKKRRGAPSEGLQRPIAGAEEGAPLSERIKAAIPVRQFVLRYVELSPRGRGLCPFHDDHNPSFSVNDEENFWHCFACGVGGSVIDFWMQWQGCDFQTAVGELAEDLLE